MTGGPASLRVTDVSKAFGAVQALDDMSFEAARGEVVGIVGDNGAGKSTLIRCITGIHRPDTGTIDVGAESFDGLDPDTARRCGIEVVHQQLALVDGMDVISNLFLNRELIAGGFLGRRFGRLARRRMATEAATALGEFGLTIRNLRRPVGELSGGQRQMLAIVRAVLRDPYFVLMDEPTAALGVEQSRRVQELVLSLKHRGIGVIVVSHRMDQVVEITDRVIVLRHGRKAAELTTSQTNAEELVAYITGARAAMSVPAGTDSRDGE